MADPRVIGIDPASGLATVQAADGSTVSVAPQGLTGSLAQEYNDLAGFGQSADPVASMRQFVSQQQAAPPTADPGLAIPTPGRQPSMRIPDITAPPAAQIPFEADAESLLNRGQRPATVQPAAQAATAPRAPDATDDEFDPVNIGQGGGQASSRYQRLLAAQAANPNAREGATGGRVVTVQGPTQSQFRQMGPGFADARQRYGAASNELAESQARALEDRAFYQDARAMEIADLRLAEEEAARKVADVQARRQETLAIERAKYNDMAAEHVAAEQRGIDPNHYYASRTTGDRIMAGIALMMGGVAAGLTGKDNPAMKIINDAIERDLIAQRENLTAKGRAADRQRGVLADTAQLYDDEQAQMVAARKALWEGAERRMAELEAMSQGAETRGQAAQLRAEAQQKIAALDMDLESALAATVTTSQRQAVVGGSPGIPIKDAIAAEKARAQGATYDPERYVPQYGGVARTKEEAQKARELAANANTLSTFYNRALQIREQYGSFTDPRARAELSALRSASLLKVKNTEQLGVLSVQDEAIVNAAQGGDWDSFANFDSARIKQAMKNMRTNEQNMAREIVIPLAAEDLPEHERATNAARTQAAQGSFQPIGAR